MFEKKEGKYKITTKDSTKLRNVINVSQFKRDNLRTLFKNTSILKQNVKKHGKLDILNGKMVGLYFDEPSSRTYGSFYAAVKIRWRCIIFG